MPTIQVKNVPRETHAELARRAAAAHQSLQAYVLETLDAVARRPTNDEVFDRLRAVGGGNLSSETAVDGLREDRDRR